VCLTRNSFIKSNLYSTLSYKIYDTNRCQGKENSFKIHKKVHFICHLWPNGKDNNGKIPPTPPPHSVLITIVCLILIVEEEYYIWCQIFLYWAQIYHQYDSMAFSIEWRGIHCNKLHIHLVKYLNFHFTKYVQVHQLVC
jgi:hypothetical protein